MAQTNANLIWKIADLLRGPYQPNQYGDVTLRFTIPRRLDCVVAHQGRGARPVQGDRLS
jgi:type I restriction enzyme M protein